MPLLTGLRLVTNNLNFWLQRTHNLAEANFALLAVEQGNLLKAVHFGQTFASTRPLAIQLARQLKFLIDSWGTWPEWQPTLEALLAATTAPLAKAHLHELIGLACRRLLALDDALTHHHVAIALLKPLNEWREVGRLQHGLCEIYLAQHNYALAQAAGQEALDIFEELGLISSPQVAAAHSVLGRVASAQGHWATAETHLTTAIALQREQGARVPLARALTALAQVQSAQQHFAETVALYQEALAILANLNNELERLTTLTALGAVFFENGQLAEAEDCFLQANTVWLRRSPHLKLRGAVTNNLGNVYLAQGRWAEAEAHFRGAARLFEQIQDHLNLGDVLGTLGTTLARQGQTAAAQAAYAQALTLLAQYPTHARARQLLNQYQTEAQALRSPSEAG